MKHKSKNAQEELFNCFECNKFIPDYFGASSGNFDDGKSCKETSTVYHALFVESIVCQ